LNVIHEIDGAGIVTDRQVHPSTGLGAGGYAPILSVGDIAMMESTDSQYVPVADQLGTLWNVLSPTASIANSYTYDAFGVNRSVSETVTNPFRFAGKPIESDSGLYHFIARQYNSLVGQFLGRDRRNPRRNGPSYNYKPVTHADATGLQALPVLEFEDCAPAQVERLRAAARLALSAMQRAHDAFLLPEPSTIDIIRDCFNTPHVAAGNEIFINRLRSNVLHPVLRVLSQGATGLECECDCPPSWLAYVYTGIRRWFEGDIHICPSAWGCSDARLAAVLIHEMTHRYADTDDVAYAWELAYGTTPDIQLLQNADSYALMVTAYFLETPPVPCSQLRQGRWPC
jgi:RHS repeat-associated protein